MKRIFEGSCAFKAGLCLVLASGMAAAGEATPVPTRQPFTASAAVGEHRLGAQRGGSAAAVVGIGGSLQQTSAINVQAGANTISEGSFANALGLTTVIQNSGANVLIQNATTVNVQFK